MTLLATSAGTGGSGVPGTHLNIELELTSFGWLIVCSCYFLQIDCYRSLVSINANLELHHVPYLRGARKFDVVDIEKQVGAIRAPEKSETSVREKFHNGTFLHDYVSFSVVFAPYHPSRHFRGQFRKMNGTFWRSRQVPEWRKPLANARSSRCYLTRFRLWLPSSFQLLFKHGQRFQEVIQVISVNNEILACHSSDQLPVPDGGSQEPGCAISIFRRMFKIHPLADKDRDGFRYSRSLGCAARWFPILHLVAP